MDDTPISRLIPALLTKVVGNRGKAAESRDLSNPMPSIEAQVDQWATKPHKTQVSSSEGIPKVTSSQGGQEALKAVSQETPEAFNQRAARNLEKLRLQTITPREAKRAMEGVSVGYKLTNDLI